MMNVIKRSTISLLLTALIFSSMPLHASDNSSGSWWKNWKVASAIAGAVAVAGTLVYKDWNKNNLTPATLSGSVAENNVQNNLAHAAVDPYSAMMQARK